MQLKLSLHSALFAPDPATADLLVAELYERGTAGIIEEGSFLRAFFEDSADYADLLSRYPVLEMRSEPLSPDFPESLPGEPVTAGQKFFIAPQSSTEETPPGRYRLVMNDSSAFGTGRHETTQLMLAALEGIISGGETVLDVGTGTGILAEAARLLGAKTVWACDIHEEGVRNARRHYAVPVFAGSADAVGPSRAHLTLANITPHILDLIAGDLKRVTRPGGIVLLSGFLQGSEPSRFKPESSWEQDGWLCWLCRPENVDAPVNEHRNVVIHSQDWW